MDNNKKIMPKEIQEDMQCWEKAEEKLKEIRALDEFRKWVNIMWSLIKKHEPFDGSVLKCGRW